MSNRLKKSISVACSLIGFQALQASISFISLSAINDADFGSLSMSIQPTYDFLETFDAPDSVPFATNFTLTQLPTIQEQRNQQAVREIAINLRAYADQLPERISISWIECFESAESRQVQVGSLVAQLSQYDPTAAMEWISLLNEPVPTDERRERLLIRQALELERSEGGNSRFSSVSSDWVSYDPQSASAWLNQIPEPRTYGIIAGGLVFALAVSIRRVRRQNPKIM
jgi:hypothetical protein